MKLRLRTVRKINNYSQKEIADLLKVTQRTYSKYESSELTLKIEHLIILRNFYKTSCDYLLGLIDKDKKTVIPKKFDYDTFVRNIRYLRYESNYSQQQLADILNCSPSLISMIERKRSIIQIDLLVLLAKTYNVTIDALLFSADKDE